MKTLDALIPLTNLPKNTQDFRRVLSVYLDLNKDILIDYSHEHLLFRALGKGFDGEFQVFAMYPNGRIYRCRHVNGYRVDMPAEVGKMLLMLKEMGYRLYGANLTQANKYRRYVTTGISNI